MTIGRTAVLRPESSLQLVSCRPRLSAMGEGEGPTQGAAYTPWPGEMVLFPEISCKGSFANQIDSRN